MRRQVAYVEKAFQTCNSYGSVQELHITEKLYFIFVFLKEILQISSITQEKILATLFSHIITHNNLDLDYAFRYPQVSSLRFEQLATKLKTQAEHKVVTRHMKGTNRATIHHLNKEKLHMLTTHTGKQVHVFWVFLSFCQFLFDFSYANFFGFSEFCKFLFGFMQGFGKRYSQSLIQGTSHGGPPPSQLQAHCCCWD